MAEGGASGREVGRILGAVEGWFGVRVVLLGNYVVYRLLHEQIILLQIN